LSLEQCIAWSGGSVDGGLYKIVKCIACYHSLMKEQPPPLEIIHCDMDELEQMEFIPVSELPPGTRPTGYVLIHVDWHAILDADVIE
jgi:hypothetical protein